MTAREKGAETVRTAVEGLAAKESLYRWRELANPAEGQTIQDALIGVLVGALPLEAVQVRARRTLRYVDRLVGRTRAGTSSKANPGTLSSGNRLDLWLGRIDALPVAEDAAGEFLLPRLRRELVVKRWAVGAEGVAARERLGRVLTGAAPLGAFDEANRRTSLPDLLEALARTYGPERHEYPEEHDVLESHEFRRYTGPSRRILDEPVELFLCRVAGELRTASDPIPHLNALALGLEQAGFRAEPIQGLIERLIEAEHLTRTGTTPDRPRRPRGRRAEAAAQPPQAAGAPEPPRHRLDALRDFAERKVDAGKDAQHVIRDAVIGLLMPPRAGGTERRVRMKREQVTPLLDALERGLPNDADRAAAQRVVWAAGLLRAPPGNLRRWNERLQGTIVLLQEAPRFERGFAQYRTEIRNQIGLLWVQHALVRPHLEAVFGGGPLGPFCAALGGDVSLAEAIERFRAYYAGEKPLEVQDAWLFFRKPLPAVGDEPITTFLARLRAQLIAGEDPVRLLQDAVTALVASDLEGSLVYELLSHLCFAEQLTRDTLPGRKRQR